MSDWVISLYSRNWHNTMNQLYFNFKKSVLFSRNIFKDIKSLKKRDGV